MKSNDSKNHVSVCAVVLGIVAWFVICTVGFSAEPSFDSDASSANLDTCLGQFRFQRSGDCRIWSNLYVGGSRLTPSDDDAVIRPNNMGAQIGIDLEKSHKVWHTLFYNYNQNYLTANRSFLDPTGAYPFRSSVINTHLIGTGYYIYRAQCHLGIQGSLGYDHYKINRKNTKATEGNGFQSNIFGEFGLDFIFGRFGVKPFYALQYDFLYHGDLGKGAKQFQGDWNGHSLVNQVGLRTNWKATDNMELQLRTVWLHELLDNPPPFYNNRFSAVRGITTPAVFYYHGNTGRDWAWLGLGLKFKVFHRAFLFFDYDVTINERHTTHFGNFGICLSE